MELLVILLGEFLLLPFFAALASLGSAIVSFISFLFEILINALIHRGAKSKDTVSNGRNSFNFLRVLSLFAGGIFVLAVLTLFIVNTFFFYPTSQWAAGLVGQKTNMEISFDEARGNIFSGKIHFENLNVVSKAPVKDKFLSAENLSMDVDVLSLLFRPVRVQHFSTQNVQGKFYSSRKQISESNGRKDAEKKVKAKTGFVIEQLNIKNVKIELYNENQQSLNLEIEKITSEPFRSEYAVFDTFFRSNISASINGHEFHIKTQETDKGRTTNWQLNNFPVNIVSTYVQKPPINWFKSGIVDVYVEDEWNYKNSAEIDMDWNLQFKNVSVKAPQSTSVITQTLAAPIMKYMNNKEDVDLKFQMVMNESQFKHAASLDAAGMWDAFAKAMAKNIAQKSDVNTEDAREGINRAIGGLKNFLDKKRQGGE